LPDETSCHDYLFRRRINAWVNENPKSAAQISDGVDPRHVTTPHNQRLSSYVVKPERKLIDGTSRAFVWNARGRIEGRQQGSAGKTESTTWIFLKSREEPTEEEMNDKPSASSAR
jgi:hypothetical protein